MTRKYELTSGGIATDVVESSVELRGKVATIVLAEHNTVRGVAFAFSHLPVQKSLKSGGVDVVTAVLAAVAKGTAIVEVDVGVGLQGAVGTVCALANGEDCGKCSLGSHGFYLTHAD